MDLPPHLPPEKVCREHLVSKSMGELPSLELEALVDVNEFVTATIRELPSLSFDLDDDDFATGTWSVGDVAVRSKKGYKGSLQRRRRLFRRDSDPLALEKLQESLKEPVKEGQAPKPGSFDLLFSNHPDPESRRHSIIPDRPVQNGVRGVRSFPVNDRWLAGGEVHAT
ncbi:unnamed protein product [Durusdinium trenchii]